MNLIPNDTTIDAFRKQFEILERIGIEGRAKMTFQLSDNLRQVVKDGVKHRHPDYDEQKTKLAVFRITYGESSFREVFGNMQSAKDLIKENKGGWF